MPSPSFIQIGPRPHYLTHFEVLDERRISATAIFPSSDPTLLDRDHVNVAHEFFAVWNAAHALCSRSQLTRPLIRRFTAQFSRVLLPDTPVDVLFECLNPKILPNKMATSSFRATLSTKDGEEISSFEGTFFAEAATNCPTSTY
ncbi:MAG: hypothetical protein WD200_00195 [Candidatus Andersenbacteria bacterium]